MAISDGLIYLDYNATTPLHPRVLEAMRAKLDDLPGNASSLHAFGRRARKVVEEAREKLAAYLGVEPVELYFTSGGTESNNLALRGLVGPAGELHVGAGEHRSVLQVAKAMWKRGVRGGTLPLDRDGRVEPEALGRVGVQRGALVSIQWVNNETGTIQDLKYWADATRRLGAALHTDGAQGFFRLRERVLDLGIDAATITAHKSFGPLGVGALYIRKGLTVEPLLYGGPQERQVRPGTENMLAIHGLGVLAELAAEQALWPAAELNATAERFRARVAAIPGCVIQTPARGAFPNVLNVAFPGLLAETILVRLDLGGIAASSGSACSSGAREPSHVLKAMGVADSAIRGSIRLSFGPGVPWDRLEAAARRLETITGDLQKWGP